MIADLTPYPAMKDSGVPWLGAVPEHWSTRPLKRWVTINAEVLPETTVPDRVFRYVDIGSVGTGILIQKPQRLRFAEAPSRARRLVRNGDTLVSTVRTYLKAIYFVDGEADQLVCSTGFAVLTPRVGTVPQFVSYLARSNAFTDRVAADSVGIAYPAIAESRFGSFHVAVPPLPEQAAIARFLDHADRRIRRYIRAKQRLITLLEEQKQALIHQAVTSGLDPNVRLKPSGVEWLGDVPEHWETWQIGHLGQVGNGSTPSRSNMGYWDGGTYPWLNSSSVNHSPITQADQFVTDLALRECHLPQVQPGSVLVAITGQGKTRGMSAVLDTEATINQHVAYVTPRNDVIGAEYLQLALSAAYRELRAISDDSGSTKGALTCWDISHFGVPLPPSVEQVEIILVTRQATRTLESASAKAAQEVMLAREYRIRLIADVVTGKLDVREAAARLSDEVEEPEPFDETDALTDGEDEPTEDLDAVPEEAEV